MENNLYYTPTIEEFHIGFEYEEYQFLEKNWKTVKCEFIKPNTKIDPKWFRVKYLDQSDIESLGWECYDGDIQIYNIQKGFDLYGLYLSNYNMLRITKESNTLFKGEIKNKSELIKLMQQLNINNNVKEF